MPARVTPRSHARGALAPLLLLLACTARLDTDPATPAPALAPVPDAIPPERRCGEAGEVPTDLPPLLAEGRAPAGTGEIHPDETLTIGGVKLRYHRSVWHGTTRAGFHGPGLNIEIDRAEVGPHAPWGTLIEVPSGLHTPVDLGPYRIDLRPGTGDPPAAIAVTVTRAVCPDAVVIEPSTASHSLWLSTEGIRFHNYDPGGDFLHLGLHNHSGARLDLSSFDYRHWLEPRPGEARSLRAGDHTVTFDRVIPGPAGPHPRLHVRARIDPTPPRAFPEPVPSTSPCGAPAAVRTRLPAGLGAIPPVVEDRRLDPGQRRKFGSIELHYPYDELPAHGHGPYREEARRIPLLQLLGDTLGGATMTGPFTGPRLARLGHELLHIEPLADGPADRVRVRRITLTCPKELTLPAPGEPVYLWLGTLGHGYVSVAGTGAIPLSLQLTADGEPHLLLASERGSLSRSVHPDLVGRGFTLDDYLVEIVDLATGDDTAFDGHRYHGGGLTPVVHLQLRVSAAP